MKKITAFLQLIRYPNLLIIAGTLYMLKYVLFTAASAQEHFVFFLFTMIPVLTATAGYVINDIADIPIDAINKPQKKIVGHFFPVRQALITYLLLVIAGLGLSLLLKNRYGVDILYIFAGTSLLLFFYSYLLKKLPLAGNFLVAVLSAIIPILVYIFEHSYKRTGAVVPGPDKEAILLSAYAILAFYSSLLREIVKDIEDREGDKQHRAYTFPVLTGVGFSKIFTIVLALIIPALCIFIPRNAILRHYLFLLFAVFFSAGIPFFYNIAKGKEKKDFSRASFWLKICMLAGILSVPLIYYFDL